MSSCSCLSCGLRCIPSVRIGNGGELGCTGQRWKMSYSFYRPFRRVRFLFYSSFEAETLNAFSTGLDVCTLVSGLW